MDRIGLGSVSREQMSGVADVGGGKCPTFFGGGVKIS